MKSVMWACPLHDTWQCDVNKKVIKWFCVEVKLNLHYLAAEMAMAQ